MEKFTLYDLLNSKGVKEFDLLEKLKVYVISSSSILDRLTADCEEYFISEVPLHLLKKEVFKVYYYENVIEVFK